MAGPTLGEILQGALSADGEQSSGVEVRFARTADAFRINALVNDPSVRPLAGGDITLPIDLTDAVADPANVFLVGEHGGLCFCWSAPGVFELHAFVLPDGRGRWAEDFLFEALLSMAGTTARSGSGVGWHRSIGTSASWPCALGSTTAAKTPSI